MGKQIGIVDWWAKEGFGVIRGDDYTKYFIHRSNLPNHLQLARGQSVTFLSRPRQKKEGWEAYDVNFTDDDIVEEKLIEGWFGTKTIEPKTTEESQLTPNFGSIKEARQEEPVEESGLYSFRENSIQEFQEFEPSLNQICEKFDLEIKPSNPEVVKRCFPKHEAVPPGNLTGASFFSQEGRGFFTCLSNERATLVIHTFYKTPKKPIQCWRAKLLRNEDGKVFDMPDKEDFKTRRAKPNRWREILRYFIDDLRKMFRTAGIETSRHSRW